MSRGELAEAVEMIRRAFPPDATVVICGHDIVETSRGHLPDGSFQVTTRRKRDDEDGAAQ